MEQGPIGSWFKLQRVGRGLERGRGANLNRSPNVEIQDAANCSVRERGIDGNVGYSGTDVIVLMVAVSLNE